MRLRFSLARRSGAAERMGVQPVEDVSQCYDEEPFPPGKQQLLDRYQRASRLTC